MDVLSASRYDDTVAWYEKKWDVGIPPEFKPISISTTSDGPDSVYAEDLNNDGRLDVLAASDADSSFA